MNANINDIFDRKIEVGPIIQFDLLQKLIEEFIKRQKAINEKVNNLDYKISSLAVGSGINDDNIFKYFDDSNTNFEIEKDFSVNKDKNNNKPNEHIIYKDNIDKIKEDIYFGKNNSKDNNIKSNNNNIQEFYNNTDQDDLNNNDDNKINKFDSPNSHNSNNHHYRKLLSRIDKLEIMVKELTKKMINTNNEQKVNMDQLRSDISGMKNNDEKIENIEKNLTKIKKALSEYNILDFFKSENSKENQETENKSENPISKIFIKKLDLIANKTKECEESIFKLKKGLTDANNLITSNKNNYNDFASEINFNLNEIKSKENNDYNNLKKIIDENLKQLRDEIKNELVKISDQQNKKVKDIPNEPSQNNNMVSKINNEKLNNISNELKDYINKSISDTEKYLKSMIKNLGIDNIRKDLIDIHQELNNKLIKSDLEYIDLKLDEFETKLKNANLQIEMIKNDVNICNDTCAKSVRMIEYLSGQVIQVYQPDLERSQKEEIMKKINSINDVQSKNLVNKIEFDNEVKNIYKKLEQTLEVESENYKFIQHIENKLKFCSSQNELRTMEQCFMNLIEELKKEFSQKFMNKPEIIKNLKNLELQIKNIYDNNSNILHMKEGDNWLLAKKPINSYLCASCESYLGELKNKNIYLPWNKIPPHEIKNHRMGSGFSRMLQLINKDLMKSAEKINNLSIKIDDKRNNNEMNKQLPRIGSQINVRHSNNPSNTFSIVNKDKDNNDNRLNNSADGMENIEIIKSYNDYRAHNEREKNLNNNKDKEDNPKVISIIKRNKKDKRDYN